MQYDAVTVEQYIQEIPEDRKEVVGKLREIALSKLPDGFEETISYGMISYVVPHSIYPKGYHVNPQDPLPFISIASQKNHISIYHFGIYFIPKLKEWFEKEYAAQVTTKLDMGKSCIRFRNPKKIPFELLEELFSKVTLRDYIKYYEESIKNI